MADEDDDTRYEWDPDMFDVTDPDEPSSDEAVAV